MEVGAFSRSLSNSFHQQMDAELLKLASPELHELYSNHRAAVLNAVDDEGFGKVEELLCQFWQGLPQKMRQEVETENCLRYLVAADRQTYTVVMKRVMPDVFRNMSTVLTKQIRNFAKSLEGWLKAALVGYPEAVSTVLIEEMILFSQRLRRYTGLNHLAQAARAVLRNHAHVSQMLQDYGRVDIANVQEQLSWVCTGCDLMVVTSLEEKFRVFHKEHNKLEDWAAWLQEVVKECLGPHVGTKHFEKSCSELLLRWSFASALVIRDLTLRSAASFGMFHLMRLLCDEYMFFLVEHALASKACMTFNHVVDGGEEVKAKHGEESDDVDEDDSETSKKRDLDENTENEKKRVKN